MFAAFDVHYFKKDAAFAAAVLFADYAAFEPVSEYTLHITGIAGYTPGAFYRRELPCIQKLLNRIEEKPVEIIIDGYAMLGNRPGLGKHLFDSLYGEIPVIGVAKSKFEGVPGVEIFRGGSGRPLYVTAVGMNLKTAAEKIKLMHGPHRIPTLLKHVDLLARKIRPSR